MIGAWILALSTSAFAAEDDWDLTLDGYFRVRSYNFSNYYADQDSAGFTTQRLRLKPALNFENVAKFNMMVDVLDNVAWGDNQSIASTSLFAGDPSNTAMDGTLSDTFKIKRAWVETNLKIGLLRFGRQESHWGMGLLANDGNGFDDQFGENHEGATFDRIVFATRPIAVVQSLLGKKPADIPFIVGYAFDRLVEDPLVQYYGYKCESGVAQGDESFDSRCYNGAFDTTLDGSGPSNVDHGYTEDRDDSTRGESWYADPTDDVDEHVVLAMYKGEQVPMFGSVGDFTLGAYGISRLQQETASDVFIWDIYMNFLYKGIYAEAEVLNIIGSTRAISLPGAANEEGSDPLYKDVNIWGYAGRLGYKGNRLTAYLEHGFAGGDENVADGMFTGRAIHPDYNVGLLIYDQVLATATRNTWGDAASALWSGGGVYNSRYLFPVVSYSVLPGLELVAAYLHVWPDKPDGAVIATHPEDVINGEAVDPQTATATEKHIGWEIDLALKARLHKHILFSLEGAYAQVTDRIKLGNIGLNPDGAFMTTQVRMAYEF